MSNEALTWAFRQRTGSAGCKAVLVALADKADEAHSCYPSQETLATMTEQGVRTVRGHLAALEAAGFIMRAPRRSAAGTRSSDRYVLAVSVAVGMTNDRAPNRQISPPARMAGRTPITSQDVPVSPPAESAARHELQPAGNDTSTGRSRQVTQREQPTEVLETAPSRGNIIEHTFDEFWSIYPRRAGKLAAKVAMAKALRGKVPAETILAGARRFAADPNLPDDRQFIAHPATWLNQGRWDDDPLPPRVDRRRQQQAVPVTNHARPAWEA